MNKIIFWGLCATLILMPLPRGSDLKAAFFAFQCVTFGLFVLHLVSQFINGRQQEGVRGSQNLRLPLVFRVLILFFSGSAVLQIIPLPSRLIQILSPHAAAIHNSVPSAVPGELERAGWLALSLAPGLSIEELIRYFFYVLFVYLIFKYVRTKKDIEIVILTMLLAALFQAFYGLLDLFGGPIKIYGLQRNYRVSAAMGTFIDHDYFSGYLEMIFPLSLGFLLAKARFFSSNKSLTLKEKIIWFGQEGLQKSLVLGLISVMIGLGIFFARSRSGIFIFGLTIFLMIILVSASSRKGERHAKIIWTVLLAVLFAAILIGVRPIIERFSGVAKTSQDRLVYYKNTLKMISDYPLSGMGFGTYVYAYPVYRKVFSDGHLSHAHNDYLELAAEEGLLGGGALIAVAFGLVGLLYSKWAQRRDHFAKGIALGCMLGVLVFLIHSLTYFNLRNPTNATYFLVLYALALRSVGLGHGRGPLPKSHPSASEPKTAGGRKSKESEFQIWRRIMEVGSGALAALSLFFAAKQYLGYHYFAKAEASLEQQTNSIGGDFEKLEIDLKKAISFSHNPRFYGALGHLYFERALAENKLGNNEHRDFYLELSVASYSGQIKKNPLDSSAYYNVGRVYMLETSPLGNHAQIGRQYFKRALDLNPSDDSMNVNVLYCYLMQWDSLRPEEREFLTRRLRDVLKYNENFIPRIVDTWRKNHRGTDKLEDILSASSLWPQLQNYF